MGVWTHGILGRFGRRGIGTLGHVSMRGGITPYLGDFQIPLS